MTHLCDKTNAPCDWELLYSKAAKERDELTINEQRIGETDMTTWHLFYIEAQTSADTCDGHIDAFIVSALSDSVAKAEELARASVEDRLERPTGQEIEDYADDEDFDADDIGVTCCKYLGVIDREVNREIGPLELGTF